MQRFLCRDCGFRFSEKKDSVLAKRFYMPSSKGSTCQVGAALSPRRVKNLVTVEPLKDGPAGATKPSEADIKGKLVEYSWWMEKQNYAKESIRGYASCLRALIQRNANLMNPESVKEALAREKSWSQNRRRNVINAYTLFLKINGLTWEKPKCQITRKIPFIPTEKELDNLIAGTGKKTATFLQLLKETAMRSGEAKRLHWTDLDLERHIITLNHPEKGSNPRMWKISQKLTDMLTNLPKNSPRIFGNGPINSLKTTYLKARKRLATKLQNPRLTQISFHTFRHWKATLEYHKTKDPYHVKKFLGHKSLQSTEIYINVEQALFDDADDEFHVKVAQDPKQVKALLEVGFEYICQKDDLLFFRKRK